MFVSALLAVMPSSASAADPPRGKIPDKYVGDWRGVSGEMSAKTTERVRTATITKVIGHTIKSFSFTVAPDGKITGSGEASYTYDQEIDADLLVSRQRRTRRVEGPATVPFTIAGQIFPDGRVEIQSTPKQQLTVIDNGKDRRQMDAWDVFMASGDLKVKEDGPKLIIAAAPATTPNVKVEWKAEKVDKCAIPNLCQEVAKARELLESYTATKALYEKAKQSLKSGDTFAKIQNGVKAALERKTGKGVEVSGETGGVIRYKDSGYALTGRFADPDGYPNKKAGEADPRRSWDVDIPTRTSPSGYTIVDQVSAAHEQAHVDTMTQAFQQFKDRKWDWNTWQKYSSFDLTGKDLAAYIDDEIKHYDNGMKFLKDFLDKCGPSCPAP